MRVESIELSWFRGAGETARLSLRAKSMVIYGTNGAGKSSFADAFEYLAAKGKIRHLAHEYSGVHQQHGLRNTHAPRGALARITLNFQSGACMNVSIQPDGVARFSSEPKEVASTVHGWDLERLILRQDEVAHFIHATKGEKYSALLPLLGLEALEHAAGNLRALHKALEELGKLAEQTRQWEGLRRSALQVLPDLSPEAVDDALYRMASTYLRHSAGETYLELVEAVEQAIEAGLRQAEPEQRRFLILQQVQQSMLGEKLTRLAQAERRAAAQADELIERGIAVLEAARDFLQAAGEEQAVVDCPACGRKIQAANLAEHVLGELNRLSAARLSRNAVIQARQDLQKGLLEVRKWIQVADFQLWLGEAPQAELREVIGQLSQLDLELCDQPWDPATWEALQLHIPWLVRLVEAAARLAPPATQELVRDQRVAQALRMIPEMERLRRSIEQLEKLLHQVGRAEAELRNSIKGQTQAIIQRVSGEIQRLWAKLHPNEPIERVELYIPRDAEKAIDICLKFFGVEQASPRLTLSEGHRNSLGLCTFLALVSLEADNNRPIILDDVVSSLDREHRGMLTRVLLEDFADRQVILLTHDREWFSELRARLPGKQWDFMALRPWVDPRTGIQLSPHKGAFGEARSLAADNPEAAGNRVRAMMDSELAIIAERLQVRLPFARGDHNDRRTCMEFLERILSDAKDKLRRNNGNTLEMYSDPYDDWQEARNLLVSWANRASHSGSLYPSEAEYLIERCEKALDHFRCEQCGEAIWYAEQTGKNRLQCACGRLVWRKEL
jgi:hypothetical protein